MEKDAAKLWFMSLTAGVIVGIDKIIMPVSYTHLDVYKRQVQAHIEQGDTALQTAR